MEELEPPIEPVHENIHHAAEHGGERWVSGVALSTAVFAAIAAVAAMLSGHFANHAMLQQMEASDKWAYYQAKGIKKEILISRIENAEELGKPVKDRYRQKIAEYNKTQDDTKHEAEHLEYESRENLQRHTTSAYAITLFQVTITVAAVSALTKRKSIWFASIAAGMLGVVVFVYALTYPPAPRPNAENDKPHSTEKHGGEKPAEAEEKSAEKHAA